MVLSYTPFKLGVKSDAKGNLHYKDNNNQLGNEEHL